MVLAYAMEKAGQCSSCGSFDYQWEEDPDAFEAMIHICPGCQRKDWAREEQGSDKLPAGASFTLVPKARAAFLRRNPNKRPRRRRRTRES